MEFRRLLADRTAVRRYVEELWLPYQRELEATVDRHTLTDDVDLVAEEVPFRVDRLATDAARTWVAVGVTASAFGSTAATPEDAEPNDDRASATALQDGEEVNGSLDAGGDVDWYAVEMTAGHGLLANLTLTSESENQSVRVDIYDPDGSRIGVLPRDRTFGTANIAGIDPVFDKPAGSRAQIADVAEANGTYYVRVARTELDDEPGDVTYALEVNTVTLDRYDPNEDGATATQATPGETVEAVFAPYDSDVYAVTVPAGTNVTVTVGADTRLEKALFVSDTAATIDDDTYDGEYLLVKDPFSFRAVVTFTAEEGGTYYVQLVQGDTNTGLVMQEPYTLTVETSSASDGDGTDDGDGSDGGDDTDDQPKEGGGLPHLVHTPIRGEPLRLLSQAEADTAGDDHVRGCFLSVGDEDTSAYPLCGPAVIGRATPTGER